MCYTAHSEPPSLSIAWLHLSHSPEPQNHAPGRYAVLGPLVRFAQMMAFAMSVRMQLTDVLVVTV